mmetsp:Transcript_28621/g.42316  ORF Transcript_28621/g.42316 Transcript_28621/m.42316 type:complete len:544 (+) Transcript_28621:69-1700(+)|eukprot:CAMPEP_0194219844 /NCGR_PEP_ID=MMETSP0156-20130528/26977_1 /TAXON_ID=33649 /ORGANISM="Thalassionema nitzschioides, Strain L26-B" /LENGTH=543 /DNA_ID=CAMNT_0038949655 /DNA_START=55 /DNA_END=1686 /DNA_ORIENTATION=-
MPDCTDIIDETCCRGSLEIEAENHEGQNPPYKRQISKVSRPKTKSEICGACSNLINSIVGAGIIGIPYALKESGLVAGALLLVLASYCTDKSLRMLVELAHFHPRLKSIDVLTFEDLMFLPFGVTGSNFVLASMLVMAYGAMVAYLLIIKDTVPIVMGLGDDPGEGSFMEREFVMIVTSLIIVVPLSMQRDMSSLSFTSAISVMADIALVFIISIFAPVKESVKEAGGLLAVISGNWISSGFFIGFGVLTTAMACQHSAFIVSGSLNKLNSKRWSIVTMISISIACILCSILGIAGYLAFLDDTQGDVLNNFDYGTIEATVARALLAFTMFFTYPMEAFVARHVIMQLFYKGDIDGDSTEESLCFNRRIKWTMVIFLATLIPAILVDNLGPVLSITGSLGGCFLAYIAPGLAYLGLHGDSFLQYVSTMLDKSSSRTEIEGGYTNMDTGPVRDYRDILDGPKPWWWYPMLMPIWIKIATDGSQGMTERLAALEKEHGTVEEQHIPSTETILPVRRDYFISIFFVAFGVIACVAGLFSNFFASLQ